MKERTIYYSDLLNDDFAGTDINVNRYVLTSVTSDGNGGIAGISYKKRTGAQAGEPESRGEARPCPPGAA